MQGFIGRSGKVAVKKLSKTDEVSEGQFKDELKCLIRVKHKNIMSEEGSSALSMYQTEAFTIT
jgi:hypothetical protein